MFESMQKTSQLGDSPRDIVASMSDQTPTTQHPLKRTYSDDPPVPKDIEEERSSSAAPKQKKKGKWASRGGKTGDLGTGRKGRKGDRGWVYEKHEDAMRVPRGAEDVSGEKKERLAKRKCAILIGFCGAGYSGMQM